MVPPRVLSILALAESNRNLPARSIALSAALLAFSDIVSAKRSPSWAATNTLRGLKNGAGIVGPMRDGPGTLSPVTPGGASGPTSTCRPFTP